MIDPEQSARDLYAWICEQPDQESVIVGLQDDALRSLNGWLARMGAVSGVPSLIHGLVLHEAAARFLKSPQGGAHD